ncbi:MAG: hypothetical protein M4579_004905 [Chaenotheca gracillima]|nr:MAG: hypothetical protein M4579_004905 [Chaenotheca gracillima]
MASADPDGTKRRRLDSWSTPSHMHHVPYSHDQQQQQQQQPPAAYSNHSLPPPTQVAFHEQEHRPMELPPPSPGHSFNGPPRYGPTSSSAVVSLPPPGAPISAAGGGQYQTDQVSTQPENTSPHTKKRSPSDGTHPSLRPLNVQTLHNGHHSMHHPLDPQSAPPTYHETGMLNGASHHGLSIASHHDMPPSHSRGYATSPVSAGGIGGPPSAGGGSRDYGYGPFGAPVPRRKAVRAAQACDACRARKAKCDEGRPSCGFCKDSAVACNYREVPPPKQDRTLGQILDGIREIKSQLRAVDDFTKQLGRSGNLARTIENAVAPGANLLPESHHEGSLARAERDAQIEELKQDESDHMENESAHEMALDPTTGQDVPSATAGGMFKLNEGDGLLTIPIEHTTAAHKLLRWPSIRSLVMPVTENENYVMQAEERRGLLRVWGRGEGQDTGEVGGFGVSYSGNSPEGDEFAYGSPSPYTQGPWGSGMMNPNVPDIRRPGEGCVGGLNADGSLKLDSATLYNLHQSYLHNIQILHPILEVERLGTMFEVLGVKYGASNPPSAARTPFMAPSSIPNQDARRESLPSVNRVPKRKWSNNHLVGSNSPAWGPTSAQPHGQTQYHPRSPPERSIGTALILLVLALGKICENGNWVPGPLVEPVNLQDSPSVNVKQSPGSYSSSINSAMSPDDRAPHPTNPSSPSASSAWKRNIDVIPGLAYYAYATDILGNLHGGHDLPHVQAGILAGLYAGQLGRVMESWSWIHWASTKCQILLHPQSFKRETDSNRIHLIKVAFWSCLQLESDILAELDLPPSGISRFEDNVTLPGTIDSEIWFYYNAQITLRVLLNRVHSSAPYKPGEKGTFYSGELLELQRQLKDWRNCLPERLRWKDSDPPPSDSNAARLRAKYYGAQYIIHRPFLHQVLHPIEPVQDHAAVNDRFTESGAYSPDAPDVAFATHQPGLKDLRQLDKRRVEACMNCIQAAIRSTEAFHGIKGRPIVTNIFGTAHAQFGNLLVLQAAARSPLLSPLVPHDHLNNLMHQTISFLKNLSAISPSLKKDADILESIMESGSAPLHMNTSFSSFGEGSR